MSLIVIVFLSLCFLLDAYTLIVIIASTRQSIRQWLINGLILRKKLCLVCEFVYIVLICFMLIHVLNSIVFHFSFNSSTTHFILISLQFYSISISIILLKLR